MIFMRPDWTGANGSRLIQLPARLRACRKEAANDGDTISLLFTLAKGVNVVRWVILVEFSCSSGVTLNEAVR